MDKLDNDRYDNSNFTVVESNSMIIEKEMSLKSILNT